MSEYIGPDAGSLGKKVYKKLLELIPKNETILELGSGISSKILKENYELITVEHDESWLNKYEEVQYIHVPLKGKSYNKEIFEEKIKNVKPYALLIDGPPGYGDLQGSREMILTQKELIKRCKVVLVDDTHRKSEDYVARTIRDEFGFESEKVFDGVKSAVVLWRK